MNSGHSIHPCKVGHFGSISLIFLVFAMLAGSSGSFAGTKTFNVASGNWNTSGNWSPGGVPAAGDDVVIPAGRTCTLNTSTASLASLSVSGMLTTDGTPRTCTVTGDVTIESGGTIQPSTSNDTHTFNLGGNLVNSGTLNSVNSSGEIRWVFNGSSSQTVSGSGATTEFWQITVNNTGAAGSNVVDIASSAFTTTVSGFLTLTRGVLKMSGSYSFSNTFFPSDDYTINANSGLWLNNANVTVTAQGADITLQGLLRVTAGAYNVGTGSGDDIRFDGSAAQVIMEGGACTIAGRFDEEGSGTDDIDFAMVGGVFTVGQQGNSSSTSASFDIESATSTFTMSGGTIVVEEDNGNPGGDFRNSAATCTITGGLLQFGNGSSTASNTYEIRAASNCPAVTVYSTTSTLTLYNGITVWGDCTILSGTTLNANAQTLTLKGNWVNDGTFTHGNGLVIMNGSAAQTMTGASSFYDLQINNSAGVTLLSQETVSHTLTLTDGLLFLGGNYLVLGTAATVGGTPSASAMIVTNGIGEMRKQFSVTGSFTFPIGDATGTAEYSPCTVTISAGTFSSAYVSARVVNSSHPNLQGTPVDYIDRFWVLGSSGISSMSATGSFVYANGDVHGNEANYELGRWNGSAWQVAGTNAPSTNTLTIGTALSSFGDFTGGHDNALPVELAGFSASLAGNAVTLSWMTVTEADNFGFDVQRSTDDRVYETLGFVAGHGTVSTPQYYTFTDRPGDGAERLYYRLMQRDRDGAVHYSPVVSVERHTVSPGILASYPNPVRSSSTIRFSLPEAGTVTLLLNNTLGQEVMRLVDQQYFASGAHALSFDATTLQNGKYCCLLTTAHGTTGMLVIVAK